MLISEPLMTRNNGKSFKYGNDEYFYPTCIQLQAGIYLTASFNSSLTKSAGYDEYPLLGEIKKFGNLSFGSINAYGVCDDVGNLLESIPELITSTNQFVVLLTEINRDSEPDVGGWRWHKWGPYVGNKTPMCEYIKDEPLIDRVYCYHVYERVKTIDSITCERLIQHIVDQWVQFDTK
jgi:hypothetical protein